MGSPKQQVVDISLKRKRYRLFYRAIVSKGEVGGGMFIKETNMHAGVREREGGTKLETKQCFS